jgi:methionine-rich copper-binding protein CopC
VLAIGAAVLIPALTVFGHSAYDHSTPNQSEVVTTPPTQVDVFFKEEVVRQAGQFFVHVANDQGTQVSDGDGAVADADRTHITATIPTALSDGRYIVRWKTVSDADGDEAEGAFCFYVNVQPSAAQSTDCAALEATETPETPDGTSAAGTETPSAPTAEASPTVAPSSGNGGDSNKGAVIGGIVGGIAVVVVVVGGVAFYLRRSRV